MNLYWEKNSLCLESYDECGREPKTPNTPWQPQLITKLWASSGRSLLNPGQVIPLALFFINRREFFFTIAYYNNNYYDVKTVYVTLFYNVLRNKQSFLTIYTSLRNFLI